MIPFRTQIPLETRFAADHTATRLIASIAQALTLQGAHVTRHGTEVRFRDLPAIWRLREIAAGQFTVDRTIPEAPVLRLTCHFPDLWWLLVFLAVAACGLTFWRSHELVPALLAALVSSLTVGLFVWIMVRLRLRLLISTILRGAAS